MKNGGRKRWRGASIFAAALVAGAIALSPARADDFTFGQLGTVHVSMPAGEPQSVAILISDSAGWNGDTAATAAALSAEGAVVMGVDFQTFKAHLDRQAKGCLYPSADIQGLAQYGESKLALKRYLQPIVVGLGDGAAFAYPLYAQPPKDTFKGVVAAGFCPVLKTSVPLCPGHAKDLVASPGKAGFTYAPAAAGLANFVALTGLPGASCPVDPAAFIAASPGAVAIPFDAAKKLPDQIAAAYRTLTDTQTDFESAQSSEAGAPGEPSGPPAGTPAHVDISAMNDLPLTVVPADGAPKSYAIFLTGDGGWAGIDQSISAVLAARGVEVVGFNTLDYYWEEKSPLQTAADLNRIFDAIRASDTAARVIIVGFSFGAEVAPVSYPLLADSSKAMLGRMVLLVPGQLAVFAFSSGYWLGEEPTDGASVADAVRADTQVPVLCIYSSDDDGACPDLAKNPPANLTLKVLGEGHHFGGAYDTLAGLILQE